MSQARMRILYGTETGNSQDVAKRIGREAKLYGLVPAVQSLHCYDVLNLPTEPLAIFVVATTGQGDVPDKMKAFWKILFRRSLQPGSLAQTQFAVFGLGDSAYVKFNVVAKKLHNRLCSLGAEAILERGLGDDQAEEGYEAALDPWLNALWIQLAQRHGLCRLVGHQGLGDCPFKIDVAKDFQTVRPDSDIEWFKNSIRAARCFTELEGMAGSEAESDVPSDWQPFFAPVKMNERITAADHFQETRHMVLGTGDSGLHYSPGDTLAMHPLTSWGLIDAFLQRLGMDPFIQITVLCKSSGKKCHIIARSLVQGVLDVGSASPRRFFFEVLGNAATDEREKERLLYLASASGREELSLYNRQSGRTVLDILSDFTSSTPSLEWMLDSCPRKMPRRFSISSSPKAHPSEVHLTVAIVEYRTKARRIKRGLCTSYLSGLRPGTENAVVPCWIERGSIHFGKAADAPLLLIGPGTGVAPFRSVLHERSALRHQQPDYKPMPSYLFFGCRNEGGDFYYASEWKTLQSASILNEENGLITAFSRDQQQKIYVSHRIKEHGHLICDLLMNQGACIYVAGSANKMPNDVRKSLLQVIEKHGEMSEVDTEAFLKQLDKQGRYQVESWS